MVKNELKIVSIKNSNVTYVENFFATKWLTTHIGREHRIETNSSVLEKPKTDNVYTENNNRTLLVGCSFSSRTYVMLKIFHEYHLNGISM